MAYMVIMESCIFRMLAKKKKQSHCTGRHFVESAGNHRKVSDLSTRSVRRPPLPQPMRASWWSSWSCGGPGSTGARQYWGQAVLGPGSTGAREIVPYQLQLHNVGPGYEKLDVSIKNQVGCFKIPLNSAGVTVWRRWASNAVNVDHLSAVCTYT